MTNYFFQPFVLQKKDKNFLSIRPLIFTRLLPQQTFIPVLFFGDWSHSEQPLYHYIGPIESNCIDLTSSFSFSLFSAQNFLHIYHSWSVTPLSLRTILLFIIKKTPYSLFGFFFSLITQSNVALTVLALEIHFLYPINVCVC